MKGFRRLSTTSRACLAEDQLVVMRFIMDGELFELTPELVLSRLSEHYPFTVSRPGLVETSALCRRMTPLRMAPRRSNSAGPNSERSPATRWRARGLHWRSSNVNALTIGAHEPRSTLRRRSRMEASGPRRYVTARGQPTGRLRTPAMRDKLRRATPRARPATRWVRRSSTPAKSYSGQTHPRIGRACRTSVRTLCRRRSRRRGRPHRAVPDPCASGRSGRPEALPERTAWWWTCRGADPNAGCIAATAGDLGSAAGRQRESPAGGG